MRARTSLFSLSWTIMHPINEGSPLYGISDTEMADKQMEVVALLSGADAVMAETIYARYSYGPDDIVRDQRFVDVLSVTPQRPAHGRPHPLPRHLSDLGLNDHFADRLAVLKHPHRIDSCAQAGSVRRYADGVCLPRASRRALRCSRGPFPGICGRIRRRACP